MKRARERFVEIAAEQHRQEEAASVLADRVTFAVRAGATSREAIAATLGLRVDEVDDGIHRAVEAGEVRRVTSYSAPAQGEE